MICLNTNYGRKLQLLAAASSLAVSIGVPGYALAQTAAPASTSLVDEIVVTARRREERVQDVPASVSSISAERLGASGVNTSVMLSQVTPGLIMSATGAYTQPAIRGISSTSITPGDEANVAIYVDGVYYAQMNSNAFQFNNIERIEVLKGPQGTLFGRNATGGAITIITKEPSFTPTGKISIGRGNLESTDAAGYVSGKITDNVAADLSVLYHNDEGYVKDLIRGGKTAATTFSGVRAKILYKPTDSLKFTLSLDTSQSEDTTNIASVAINGNTVGRTLNPSAPIPTGPYQYLLTVRPRNIINAEGASFRADVNLGWASFMSLTSARHEKYRGRADVDGTLVQVRTSIYYQPSDTYTQEFQLNSPSDSKIQWVGGVYVFQSVSGYVPIIAIPQNTYTVARVKTDAYAVFGEATFSPIDRVSITAGLRYSYERKVNFGKLSPTSPDRSFTDHWDDVTPRLVVKYEIPDVVNLYGSFSKGFKSGQFNATALNGIPVAPEKIDAYEIGAKTLRAGAWRASVAAYRYNYKDIQVSARLAGAALVTLGNAAAAVIKGAEFQVDGRVTPELTVNFGLSLLDAKYKDFTGANITFPLTTSNPVPATSCVPGTGTPVGGNRQIVCDVTGRTVIRSPKWTVNAGAQYRRALMGGEFDASANIFATAKYYWEPSDRLQQNSYMLLNGQLGWTTPDGHTRFSVWGKNLTDTTYFIVVGNSTSADYGAYAAPRTFGVQVAYTY
ncbi:MAG: hypothetical protein JWQ97_491 [Phenylobacterium sp.]|nr:hypothetical protein [Phenylobacterium sp.]